MAGRFWSYDSFKASTLVEGRSRATQSGHDCQCRTCKYRCKGKTQHVLYCVFQKLAKFLLFYNQKANGVLGMFLFSCFYYVKFYFLINITPNYGYECNTRSFQYLWQ